MIIEEVINILSTQLNVPVDEITLDSVVTEDLGADSLDIVELIAVFESLYQITIEDEKIMEIKTVSEICDYIKEYNSNII